MRSAGLKKLGASEGETILDVGIGTGHETLALAGSVGEFGRVVGVDISSGMLRVARSRIGKEGLADRIDLLQTDAAHLPFKADAFDGLFMSFTLELFDTPEIPLVLKECRQALRPEGRISVVSLSKSGGRSLMRNLYERCHDRFPEIIDCRPIFVRRALEDAGFEVLDSTQTSIWGLPVEIVLAERSE
ncbi:MAG TPA: methyltransferase domain-containing protein [Methanotrichaceae archaeon]|nr:methyltransferase domain-containing protein [Methanotrichaceae archaeon]